MSRVCCQKLQEEAERFYGDCDPQCMSETVAYNMRVTDGSIAIMYCPFCGDKLNWNKEA